MNTNTKYEKLRSILKSYPSLIVAYSGGVDSAFLLKVAYDILDKKVLAVLAVSSSLSKREKDSAIKLLKNLGVRYKIVNSEEMKDENYIKNAPNRCYSCKMELFTKLTEIAKEEKIKDIADGFNTDDLKDYRPGAQAAREFKIHHPLQEAELTKMEIRELSKILNLPTWDKPSAPCLSSRIPYGIPVEESTLRKIEMAEDFLKDLGFKILRVRHHNNIARIEISEEELPKLIEIRKIITKKFKEIGYVYVTIDLEGYRMGSANEVLPLIVKKENEVVEAKLLQEV
jgi:uncharacterized protein